MVLKIKYRFVLLISLVLAFTYVNASVDKQQWVELTEGVDYNEDYLELTPPENQEVPEIPQIPDLSFLREVLIVVVLLILCMGLFFIYRNTSLNPKVNKKNVGLSDKLEDHIHEADLEALFQEAFKKEEWQQAIRVLYLIQIRDLSIKKLIDWKREKTNHMYVSELKGKPFVVLFKKITLLYERVWFGKLMIGRELFAAMELEFKAFEKEVLSDE